MAAIKYKVELTEAERSRLNEVSQRGKASVRTVKRALSLLKADQGLRDREIADVLLVNAATVARARKRYVEEGLEAAINDRPRPGQERKLDGKQEAHLIAFACSAAPEALVVDVAQLARTRYAGVNHTHLAELLAEREGIHIGRTTLRRVLLDAGLSSPRRRRPPKHRVRRQRMPQEGMLIQMDGSYHPWLGDQAPPFTLLIAVDDATGQVVSAWFCEHEDARSYFLLIRALVEHRGVPVALYTDRHAVFKHTPGPGLPAGPTQFSRAMDEMGTQMIFAQSPQAKGRVERTGGTFQDRLVAELRLAGATTLEQAQAVLDEFVPRFNRRFGVPPQCSEPAFRPLDPELCLEQVLCFKHRRKVDRDNTVRFQLRTLQLLPAPERPSYAGATVEVLEGLDGQLKVRHEGRSIAAQEAPPSPVSLRNGHQPPAVSPVAPIGVNHWDERWTAHLAPLVSSQEPEADQPDFTDGEVAAARPATVAPRKPTFLQRERWTEGEMEGGPESPAQGHVAAGNRTGVGHPQVHRQELSGGRRSSRMEAADGAQSVDIGYHGSVTE